MRARVMAKADFYTGLLVFALGVYMIIEGLRLPGAGGFIETGGEPGRVPIMLGAILVTLALALIVRSVARGGHITRAGSTRLLSSSSGWLRSGFTALGCSVYAVGLLGAEILGWRVQYREATILFVFLFITCAEWSDAPDVGLRRWEWVCRRSPSKAGVLDRRLGFIPKPWVPYLWLIFTALAQALVVAFAIGYLFEKELYVKLP